MAASLLMNPVKQRFYTERYEKENKLISVRETFAPNARAKSLTGKFYARHDVISLSDVRENDVALIKRATESTPKDIYSFRPPVVNMEYGWYVTPLVPITRDPRLRFSRRQSDFVATELAYRKFQKILMTKKFTGIPFKT